MSIDLRQLTEEERLYLRTGEFGLEKEGLRVTADGYLAHTPHPFEGDPKRDRDFCENQVEMITGVSDTVEGVIRELSDLHYGTLDQLQSLETGKEILWPFSNPPYVRSEEDIPVAHFTGELASKEEYRNYLAEKYGKRKMLFSGIHFNFSFDRKLIETIYKKQSAYSLPELKNRLYLDLAGKTLKYTWLIIYLTAASPVFDGSLQSCDKLGQPVVSKYASIRCGENGYWNKFMPALDFSSLENYVQSINSYIDSGQIRAASELYYPVRLKPRGNNSMESLLENGVNHIELRMFDLNPLSPVGIEAMDLEFVFYLLTYLALLPDEPISVAEQVVSIRNAKKAALLDANEIKIEKEWLEIMPVREAASEVIDRMEEVLSPIMDVQHLEEVLSYQKRKISDDGYRYANRVAQKYAKGYVKQYCEEMQKTKPYVFYGWKHATAKPVTTEYEGIETPQELYDALQHVWSKETCAPRLQKDWSKENITLGQCSITAFLVQDIFGGQVRGIRRPAGNFHCYNVTREGAFDLTSEQFDEQPDYSANAIQLRETHFSKEEKRQRYEKLRADLHEYLKSEEFKNKA